MAFKIEDAFSRYIGRECTLYTLDEEFDGTLKEVGEGFLLLDSNGTDIIINISNVTGAEFDD